MSERLSDREKYLTVKYAYLIDKLFRLRRASAEERDNDYGAAAFGLIEGVRSVDNAAAAKTFSDEEDKARYYESYLLAVMRNRVRDKHNRARTLSRGGGYTHVSLSAPLRSCADEEDGGTLEDTLADTSSASGYKAVENRMYIDGLLHGSTALQRMICGYIACGYPRDEIARRLNVSVRRIGRELTKLRNSAGISVKRTQSKQGKSCISAEHGRYRITLYTGGKKYRIDSIDPDKAESVRDELLRLRDADPAAMIKHIEEINAEIKSQRQYKNPRNIRKYRNCYTVRLSIDGVMESVGMIPTLDEAVKVRDDLIAARKQGFKAFYDMLDSYKAKYGGGK